MQRLFTMFADGWPGLGLLAQRLVIGIALISRPILMLNGAPAMQIAPHIAGAVLGLCILVGFWTPLAGALIAAVELWIALVRGGNTWISVILAVFGATLAMIGPGGWSIDAWLFGRKRIRT